LHDVFLGTVSSILGTYSINFKGLKLGKHSFQFDVNDAFFNEFEESEIKRGYLTATVNLEKHSQMLDIRLSIEGFVEVQCDRCLEAFQLPVSYKGNLFVKIGVEDTESTEEVIFLPTEDHELNLAQYIYESICLSLPYQRYHGVNGTNADDCDREMLKKLNELKANSAQHNEVDPRWDKLKDIKLN